MIFITYSFEKFIKCGIFFVAIFSLVSCSKSEVPSLPIPKVDKSGLNYFIDKNELLTFSEKSPEMVNQRKLGDFEYTLKQLTPDLMALQELKGNTSDKKEFEMAKSHYSDLLYFKFNIQNSQFNKELLKYNLEEPAQYGERVKYCSFSLGKDFYLTNGQDTVPCALHEFERTFNVGGGLNFLVTFPKINSTKNLTVVYHDQLFKQGIIKFNYNNEKSHLPYLKIN